MRFPDRGEACIAAGILGQVHGQHIPISLSGMLIAGGMAWAVMERYWEVHRSERDLAEMERIHEMTRD